MYEQESPQGADAEFLTSMIQEVDRRHWDELGRRGNEDDYRAPWVEIVTLEQQNGQTLSYERGDILQIRRVAYAEDGNRIYIYVSP